MLICSSMRWLLECKTCTLKCCNIVFGNMTLPQIEHPWNCFKHQCFFMLWLMYMCSLINQRCQLRQVFTFFIPKQNSSVHVLFLRLWRFFVHNKCHEMCFRSFIHLCGCVYCLQATVQLCVISREFPAVLLSFSKKHSLEFLLLLMA